MSAPGCAVLRLNRYYGSVRRPPASVVSWRTGPQRPQPAPRWLLAVGLRCSHQGLNLTVNSINSNVGNSGMVNAVNQRKGLLFTRITFYSRVAGPLVRRDVRVSVAIMTIVNTQAESLTDDLSGSDTFVKLVAGGNDFALVDGEIQPEQEDLRGFGVWACQQQAGIGADGLLQMCRTGAASIDLTVVNPDGSIAKMCGNGARCAAHYAFATGMGSPLSIQLGRHSLRARRTDGLIEMTSPQMGGVGGPIRLLNLDFYTVNTGTEYAVAFVDDLDSLDVASLGHQIRYHGHFAPGGTSVGFAEMRNGRLRVRTYERGNEDETLSCGSSTVACVIVARHLRLARDDLVSVQDRSGTTLSVHIAGKRSPFDRLTLAGPARVVFTGSVKWPSRRTRALARWKIQRGRPKAGPVSVARWHSRRRLDR